MSVHFQGAQTLLEFLLIYFYDATGFPRWGLGVSTPSGPEAEITVDQFTGYCRSCEPTPLTTQAMGTVSHQFSITEERLPTAVFDVDLSYRGAEGGIWERTDTVGEIASNTAPGLVPVPDQISADTPLAIEDVTVVPMEGDKALLHHQTVVISDGEITALGPRGETSTPSNAIHIDGRNLYLGPGLSEMHLHVSFGGQAAEEAGLLLIANGVTTVLNMGDSFTMDVPGLGEKFGSGELIGPSFYAGQVAFGTSDNSGAANTVATPGEATSWSNQIATAGYDYIKVYWGITPDTMDRFAMESQQLGIPIIGHIPLTQGIRPSFLDGQIMAAHAQEPWLSFMRSQIDDTLIEPAAAHFLDFGVYLTPTLAVFESWTSVWGGDVEAFNELAQRDGVTYIPPNLRTAWLSYFNSTRVQGNGQVIGALDNLYEFFLRLTKAFHDLGVPLLVGTDAPGFPGVMSGFGAYRELELFQQAGLEPADIYRAASTNAGKFVSGTLGEQPFGTVTVGNRADLILTTADPMTAIENLHRPHGVISRGRLWSQDFLQSELDKMAERYAAGKELSPDIMGPEPGLPFCADHLIAPEQIIHY